jgi:hypothetical protein
MRRIFPVALALSLVMMGCKAKEMMDKASIASDLHKRGTVDLMKEVSEDKYTPPADGKLTDGQVQMYLKVREHEKQIAQVAKQELQQHADAAKKAGDKSLGGMVEGFKGLSALGEFATADIRAAKDLKYNTQEYLWVKGKILEASTSAAAEKMTEAMNANMDASYQQMKKSYDEAKDEQTRKVYGDMMANFEKSKQEMAEKKDKVDPALAYNRQLLSKYEGALNAWAQEMAKYEDKPGEAQKSVDQWNKDMDKSIQEAKEKAKQ